MTNITIEELPELRALARVDYVENAQYQTTAKRAFMHLYQNLGAMKQYTTNPTIGFCPDPPTAERCRYAAGISLQPNAPTPSPEFLKESGLSFVVMPACKYAVCKLQGPDCYNQLGKSWGDLFKWIESKAGEDGDGDKLKVWYYDAVNAKEVWPGEIYFDESSNMEKRVEIRIPLAPS
ncbi:hypothetical protein HDV05_000904 [Chytridiales sp. JEL 0842]|nr:hypothetical protein HDV05_000904 [Chytridiales sp. JEL 0842]